MRLWSGDSRGRWEGNTLVVDTTNFSQKSNFMGAAESLHIVERFTRVAEDTLQDQVTVDDRDDLDQAVDGHDSHEPHAGQDSTNTPATKGTITRWKASSVLPAQMKPQARNSPRLTLLAELVGSHVLSTDAVASPSLFASSEPVVVDVAFYSAGYFASRAQGPWPTVSAGSANKEARRGKTRRRHLFLSAMALGPGLVLAEEVGSAFCPLSLSRRLRLFASPALPVTRVRPSRRDARLHSLAKQGCCSEPCERRDVLRAGNRIVRQYGNDRLAIVTS